MPEIVIIIFVYPPILCLCFLFCSPRTNLISTLLLHPSVEHTIRQQSQILHPSIVRTIRQQSHQDIGKHQSTYRGYMWWPGLDKDIEVCVKECYICQSTRKSPPVVPLHPWSWPEKVWSRVHIDYAGPVEGKMFLLLVPQLLLQPLNYCENRLQHWGYRK